MGVGELRPVVIEYEEELIPGWFHGWGGTSEYAYALIEIPTGHVVACDISYFRFTDHDVEASPDDPLSVLSVRPSSVQEQSQTHEQDQSDTEG